MIDQLELFAVDTHAARAELMTDIASTWEIWALNRAWIHGGVDNPVSGDQLALIRRPITDLTHLAARHARARGIEKRYG